MIFNLFKSKPTLKELIPDGFVDIHSHILPAVDDGAKNIEESLELISKMKELGFYKIVGTPHTYQGLYNNTNFSIEKSYNLIKENLKEKIKVDYASEYMIDDSLIKKSQEKSLLTIKKNYVRVEMSFISEPINLFEILFEIMINGYIPIIAHPERYRFLHRHKKKYEKLKNVGCKFQLNLLSVTDYYGKDVRKFSDFLLKNNFIDFVGSDIHNLTHLREFENKVKVYELNKLENCVNSNSYFK